MSVGKEERYREILIALAAQYINVESNRTSMITVTGVEFQSRGRKAVVLVTVLPLEEEQRAIEFLNRKRNDFWRFVERESAVERIPSFSFAIDTGEKNRQRIDSLLNE